MRSLRSRLILGSSLIAIVPLVIVTLMLSRRIDAMVRTQAAERLNVALGSLGARLSADGVRTSDRLEIVAKDAELKRMYLLRPRASRDLQDDLAERRFLLGLDFLQIVDSSGAVVADGGATSSVIAMDTRALEQRAYAERRPPCGFVRDTLEGSAGLALTSLTHIRYENEIVGMLRGGQVLDSAYLAVLHEASGIDLVLRDRDGHTLASTVSNAGALRLASGDSVVRISLAGRSYLGRGFALDPSDPGATIVGLIATRPADRAIAALDTAALLLGVLGLLIAISLGVMWSSQISGPVEQLAAFSHRLAQGEWDQPLTLQSVRELQTLVGALERMRTDLTTYRARLITSERQAAWGQMARRVAHEIKNPLTPIAISVSDLKRSYDQQRPEFPAILDQAVRTISEEVERLRRLLQEFSDFGTFPAPRLASCGVLALMEDLGVLYGREIADGKLRLVPPEREITFEADAGQIRQALVNLIKNALEATDAGGQVTISAQSAGNVLEIVVSDSGAGLSANQRANLFVPGFTTKSSGSGLGLTIVERILTDHGGTIALDSSPVGGTTFRLRIPREPGRS